MDEDLSHTYPIEGIGNLTLPMGRLVGSPIGCGAHGQGVIGVEKTEKPNLSGSK